MRARRRDNETWLESGFAQADDFRWWAGGVPGGFGTRLPFTGS